VRVKSAVLLFKLEPGKRFTRPPSTPEPASEGCSPQPNAAPQGAPATARLNAASGANHQPKTPWTRLARSSPAIQPKSSWTPRQKRSRRAALRGTRARLPPVLASTLWTRGTGPDGKFPDQRRPYSVMPRRSLHTPRSTALHGQARARLHSLPGRRSMHTTGRGRPQRIGTAALEHSNPASGKMPEKRSPACADRRARGAARGTPSSHAHHPRVTHGTEAFTGAPQRSRQRHAPSHRRRPRLCSRYSAIAV